MACIDLLSLGLIYVKKKFFSFCQVLKKMNKKENWFLFFCLTVQLITARRNIIFQQVPLRVGTGWGHTLTAVPRPIQHFVLHWVTIAFPMRNKYVGPPYSRTKIYAARMSRGSSSHRSTSAARARPQQQTRRPPLLLLSTDGRDRRTDRHSTVF